MKIENEHFEINVIPSINKVLDGISNKLYVLVELRGKAQPKPEDDKPRDPVDLALVLDRSGSMAGQKIEYAKKGVSHAIENLSADDFVTLIIYDDQIEVLFKGYPHRNRKEFLQKVSRITHRNSTALYDALKRGFTELPKDTGKTKKVFLFSDGLANVGIRDPSKIKELAKTIFDQKATVSSFGIGDDFNEDLMSGIAEFGRGDYFYIEDPDQIPTVINEALEGIVNILANDIKLSVKGTTGTTVLKAFNYKSPVNVSVPVYREEDIMEILFEIDVIPSKLNENKDMVEIKLEYLPSDALNITSLQGITTIQITNSEIEIMEENERVMNFLVLE